MTGMLLSEGWVAAFGEQLNDIARGGLGDEPALVAVRPELR
jgi:hypothetical protein